MLGNAKDFEKIEQIGKRVMGEVEVPAPKRASSAEIVCSNLVIRAWREPWFFSILAIHQNVQMLPDAGLVQMRFRLVNYLPLRGTSIGLDQQ